MLADRQRRLEPLLERVHAQRVEPPRPRAEPRHLAKPVQRPAAPQRQRPLEEIRRGTGIALRSAPRPSSKSSSKRRASTVASSRA